MLKTKIMTIFMLMWTFTSSYSQLSTDSSVHINVRSDTIQVGEQVYRVSKIVEFIYKKPKLFDFLIKAPAGFKVHAKSYVKKKNLPLFGAIVASTVMFVAIDQQIVDSANDFGKHVGISDRDYSVNLSPIPKLAVFVPNDLGTALYFIGDGFTHLAIDVAFLTYGLVANDNRALQTASQIIESLALVGTYVQILKHTTGRECPDKSTAPGGVWRVFPDQIKTLKNVPKYDAFPSGHLATVMSTLTVIAENYPEYKFIRPIGYTLMALLSFQMLNNGVHWMSDYPLALFIGYDIAKIVVNNGRRIRNTQALSQNFHKKDWLSDISFLPTVFRNSGIGFQINYVF